MNEHMCQLYWDFFSSYRLKRREKFNKSNRKMLRNTAFSLISSNCNGALLLHDLGLKFRTPTVNLWFEPSDYVEFLTHMKHYLSLDVTFDPELEEKYGYPVGVLGDKVKIYFQHYKTHQEAKSKWEERSKRVNFNNLYIWFTDRDGCTYEDIKNFDLLPYANKVIFTHVPYPEFKSAYYIKGFENEKAVGLLFDFVKATSEMKFYDQFPYIKWFNGDL